MPFLPPNQQCQSTEGDNTINAHIHQSKEITQTQKKPSLVAFYGIRPGNGACLFSNEMTKGGHKYGKSEEKKDKWGSI